MRAFLLCPCYPLCVLQLFAGELLALVGPLDPAAIAFDPANPFRQGGALTCTLSPLEGDGWMLAA